MLWIFPLVALADDVAWTSKFDNVEGEIAWANVARSVVKKNVVQEDAPVHVCRGKLIYSTSSFINQAEYAAELIRQTTLEDGSSLAIDFTTKQELDVSQYVWSGHEDTETAFRTDSLQFADPNFCVVLVETRQADENINGMAWVCTMCSSNFNVAFINTLMDDALTFSVIMHELGHLLCATHDHRGGVMRPVAKGDHKAATFSGMAVTAISEAVEAYASDNPSSCLSRDTSDSYPHSIQEHQVCDGCRDEHRHVHDDPEMAAVAFIIIFVIVLTLTLPLCLWV